jgi:hypothetical protein
LGRFREIFLKQWFVFVVVVDLNKKKLLLLLPRRARSSKKDRAMAAFAQYDRDRSGQIDAVGCRKSWVCPVSYLIYRPSFSTRSKLLGCSWPGYRLRCFFDVYLLLIGRYVSA